MTNKPKNVLMFIPDKDTSYSLFMGRIEKYLQTDDTVQAAWEVHTDEQFINQINKQQRHYWHALILDSKIIENKEKLIENFIDKNPNARIGILFSEIGPQTISPIDYAIIFTDWSDIDDWLQMMHTLLRDY